MSAGGDGAVSVVMAVHDEELHLPAAIESVLAQTRPAGEIVVVDDGSTDGTAAVAAGFGPPVRVVSQEQAGLSAALNNGLKHASGGFIAFLDGDDVWTPRHLESLLSLLEADPELDLAFGAVEQFHSPELADEARSGIGNKEGVAPGRLRGAMVARAPAFERVGPFDERWKVGEFVDWSARAEEAGLRSADVDEVVLRRRLHTSHMSRDREAHLDYARIVAEARRRRHK